MPDAVTVTLCMFIGGLIFHAGQLAARLNQVEEMTKAVSADVKAIRSTLDRVIGTKG